MTKILHSAVLHPPTHHPSDDKSRPARERSPYTAHSCITELPLNMAKPRSKKTYLPLSRRFIQYFQAPRERRQTWFRAVMNGDVTRMAECLSDGQPIDEFGDWGRSALFMASERGRTNVIEFLCSAGADVEVVEQRVRLHVRRRRRSPHPHHRSHRIGRRRGHHPSVWWTNQW